MCACICLFPLLLSYVPFLFLNNSCFKILRVDSGERENINLRPTPSVKVISHLSPTLASCHVTRTASLAHSLSPTASITRAISLAHSLIALMEPMKSRRTTPVEATCFESQMSTCEQMLCSSKWISNDICYHTKQKKNPIQLLRLCVWIFSHLREQT